MKTLGNLRWFWKKTFRADCRLAIGEILGSLFSVVIAVFCRIWATKRILDYVTAGDWKNAALWILIGGATEIFFSVLRNRIAEVIRPLGAIRLRRAFQKELYQKMVRFDLAAFADQAFYDRYFLTAKNADGKAVEYIGFISDSLSMILEFLLTGAILTAVLPWLLPIVWIPPVLCIFFDLRMAGKRVAVTEAKIPGERRKDYIRRVFFSKEYAMELRTYPYMKEKLSDFLLCAGDTQLKNMKKPAKERSLLLMVSGMLHYLQIVAIFMAVTYAALALKSVSVGDVSALIAAASMQSAMIRQFSALPGVFREYGVYAGKFRAFFEKREESEKECKLKAESFESLFLSNISFGYGERPVLQDLSLTLQRGEKAALIGKNGSGKTTLIKILLDLYRPDNGKITVNQTELLSLEEESWRQKISTVFQDFRIYPFTVAENILLRTPRDEKDRERAWDALNKVALKTKVEDLPEGIDTPVTKEFAEHGAVFSGGEKQRLMIARAITADADVILMDEPTASLDPESESVINRMILDLAKEKTVLVVSHRLTTIAGVERILLLENGKITEDGTHHELMEKEGRYAEIYRLQSAAYTIPEQQKEVKS